MITTITILSNGNIAPNNTIPLGHKYDNGLDSIQFNIPKEYNDDGDIKYNHYLAFGMKKVKTILLPISRNTNRILEFIITSTVTCNAGLYDMVYIITEGQIIDSDIDNAKKVFVSDIFKGQVLDNFLVDSDTVTEEMDKNLQIIYDNLLNLRNKIITELENGEYIGDTFIPNVNEDGVLSWTQTKGNQVGEQHIQERNLTGPMGPYYQPTITEDGKSIGFEVKNSVLNHDPAEVEPVPVYEMVDEVTTNYLDENLEEVAGGYLDDHLKPTVDAAVDAKFKWTWNPDTQTLYIEVEEVETIPQSTDGVEL